MSFMYQTGWGVRFRGQFEDCQEYDSKERAVARLQHSSNLARVVCPLRVIDENGVVHAWYDPEEDMRLPGCRWRKTKLMAYFLWENAGRPVSDGMEFWLRAEAMIDDNAQCVFMN
jgi:hypothetical protein